MPPDDRFAMVVIGSGPVGEKAAAQAAFFGKRVAAVERSPASGIFYRLLEGAVATRPTTRELIVRSRV